ncbi:unnamed protein product [Tetraodon nigroviridis]|uniref:(spotted green pufferfish) hypothetical protein n=1 Tax=Tetraodon nigroviridis TaxID=99883 RepID=Q4TF49_TETNG|nr:unnamed protein product [Tetraodon nigroviridis]CAG11980.1 unnamed protein product [Tetraodon nigroviridis]
MSDTKVKVAVRVRPMNRRGKFFHLYCLPRFLSRTFTPNVLRKLGRLRHCCFQPDFTSPKSDLSLV